MNMQQLWEDLINLCQIRINRINSLQDLQIEMAVDNCVPSVTLRRTYTCTVARREFPTAALEQRMAEVCVRCLQTGVQIIATGLDGRPDETRYIDATIAEGTAGFIDGPQPAQFIDLVGRFVLSRITNGRSRLAGLNALDSAVAGSR